VWDEQDLRDFKGFNRYGMNRIVGILRDFKGF